LLGRGSEWEKRREGKREAKTRLCSSFEVILCCEGWQRRRCCCCSSRVDEHRGAVDDCGRDSRGRRCGTAETEQKSEKREREAVREEIDEGGLRKEEGCSESPVSSCSSSASGSCLRAVRRQSEVGRSSRRRGGRERGRVFQGWTGKVVLDV
jgi:hypothetical protein